MVERTYRIHIAAELSGVPVWVGGPAAQAHREVCERLGARVFGSGDDWAQLL